MRARAQAQLGAKLAGFLTDASGADLRAVVFDYVRTHPRRVLVSTTATWRV